MDRKYHPYWVWEDYLNGMWRKPSSNDIELMLPVAIEFTGNHVLYGHWMKEVVNKWHIACEHNLTDLEQNRRAWIGHCAVCLAKDIPESITRMEWSFLSIDQQEKANSVADIAIELWERKNGGGLYAKELFEL